MHIDLRVWIGVVLFIALLPLLGFTNLQRLHEVEDASSSVEKTHSVLLSAHALESALKDAETGQRGYLLTGNKDYLLPYARGSEQVLLEFQTLLDVTKDHPLHLQLLLNIEPLITEKLAELATTIEMFNRNDRGGALELVNTNRGQQLMTSIRAGLANFLTEEISLLDERQKISASANQQAIFSAVVSIILSAIILCLVAIFSLRKVRSHIDMIEKNELQLKYLANHDNLTGLATRRLFQENLTKSIAIARRANNKTAVLFIDLDGFKAVNDNFGHDLGDQLLISVAERLSTCVREIDTLARIGGDEFMIVLTNIGDQQNASLIAQKIIDKLAEPFEFEKNNISISASIGIALYPDHEECSEALLRHADDMMYKAKSEGKNNYAFPELA